MSTLRDSVIARINEHFVGRKFTAADFYLLPEVREYENPNVAIAQILCSLVDRRGVLKRTGGRQRIGKAGTKPLVEFTTIGNTPIPVMQIPVKSVTVAARIQGFIDWSYGGSQ